ncbi:Acidic amino acid decarboxylase GADL1 [Smittium culicis]|uniref:Acidic amino acid decarboxylase GADL1 n=1 Tax=Smittium culicis TaxID=133412 RepID=A0A1R1Y334_9FUNG|nr:Acidic amino acid decarboxylase GADL1 [Smittium culicis]
MIQLNTDNFNMSTDDHMLPNDADIFDSLNQRLSLIFSNYIKNGQESKDFVLEYLKPEQLIDLISPEPPLQGKGEQGIIADIQNILKYSPNTWNPGFMHKLYSSTSAIGVVGELVATIINGNSHVYVASPVASVIEVLLSKKLGALFGYNESICGGLTCPGGSASNNMALLVARNTYFPYAAEHGFALSYSEKIKFNFKQPVAFTSNQCHYSIEKSMMMLGLGKKNLEYVNCNINGAMDTIDLENRIKNAILQGKRPFFVNATAGTTVLGQFDPILKLSQICQKYDIWLHVDASLGGSLIFSKSETTLNLLNGTAKSNSITFNSHKLLGVPLQCSYLLFRDGLDNVRAQVSSNANYLFHDDQDDINNSLAFSPNDQQTLSNNNFNSSNKKSLLLNQYSAESWDIGNATIGCGRKPDSIKMWLSWRYFGTNGFASRVDNSLNSSSSFATLIKSSPNFILFREPISNLVCFYHIPISQRNDPDLNPILNLTSSHDNSFLNFPDVLATYTKSITALLNKQGKLLVDFASINLFDHDGSLVRIPEFFRIPFNSPFFNIDHLQFIIDQIEIASATIYP